MGPLSQPISCWLALALCRMPSWRGMRDSQSLMASSSTTHLRTGDQNIYAIGDCADASEPFRRRTRAHRIRAECGRPSQLRRGRYRGTAPNYQRCPGSGPISSISSFRWSACRGFRRADHPRRSGEPKVFGVLFQAAGSWRSIPSIVPLTTWQAGSCWLAPTVAHSRAGRRSESVDLKALALPAGS